MGITRGFFHMGALLFMFIAGYSYARHVYSDQRYRVQRDKEQAYLVDLARQQRLPIDDPTFQVGSLEYRLSGILADPHFPSALEHYPRRD